MNSVSSFHSRRLCIVSLLTNSRNEKPAEEFRIQRSWFDFSDLFSASVALLSSYSCRCCWSVSFHFLSPICRSLTLSLCLQHVIHITVVSEAFISSKRRKTTEIVKGKIGIHLNIAICNYRTVPCLLISDRNAT